MNTSPEDMERLMDLIKAEVREGQQQIIKIIIITTTTIVVGLLGTIGIIVIL